MNIEKPTYSVIVPIYNEKENIQPLYNAIIEAMHKVGKSYEIIFVNDGSDDGSLKILQGLSSVIVIDFRKNFGQTAALDAGFKYAKGDYFITMDGDGQNPPSEIPKLIEEMSSGEYDVVSGWRHKRKDSFMKRFVSRGANFLRSFLVRDDIHDSGCSLKIYKKECFDGVDLHGEMHRFIPAILRWRGYNIGEVRVEHKPRIHGTTKYSWKRTIKGFVDMISVWFWRKYANRPLHLFGGAGLALSFLGFVLFSFLFFIRIFYGYPLADKIWPLVAMLMIVTGIQFFVTGILADILIRGYYSDSRTAYSIKNIHVNE